VDHNESFRAGRTGNMPVFRQAAAIADRIVPNASPARTVGNSGSDAAIISMVPPRGADAPHYPLARPAPITAGPPRTNQLRE
jgi:hypothetical protein